MSLESFVTIQCSSIATWNSFYWCSAPHFKEKFTTSIFSLPFPIHGNHQILKGFKIEVSSKLLKSFSVQFCKLDNRKVSNRGGEMFSGANNVFCLLENDTHTSQKITSKWINWKIDENRRTHLDSTFLPLAVLIYEFW